jgi:Tol biopolymer transport system component
MRSWIGRSNIQQARRFTYAAWLAAGLVGLYAIVIIQSTSVWGSGPAAITTLAPASDPSLTNGSVMDGFGAWARNGKTILFMRDGRIWRMQADGTAVKALTTTPDVWDAVPAFAPGEKAITFIRLQLNGDGAAVMLRDLGTGKERTLTAEKEPIGHLAWAGESLLYTTPSHLYRLDVQSGKKISLVSLPEGWEMTAGGLTVHPDQKTAVFGAGRRSPRGVDYDLWQVATTPVKGRPERLTQTGGIMPAFDPGGAVLYYRNPRSETGIFRLDLQTHAATLLVADGPKVMHFHPAVSPNGQWLLLSRLRLDGEAGLPDTPGQRFISHLYLHRLRGSGGS